MTKVSKKSHTQQSCKTGVVGSADFVAVSLFDGMSCFQLALNKIGKTPTKYYASEIEKYPIQVTMANYPNTIQIGDVRNVNGKDLGFVHALAGGSPCQSFSFAGKRKGMATKCEVEILSIEHYLELKQQNFEFEGQSYLFWEYIRILNELRETNPNIYFLLENVVMGEKWQKVLTRAIGINPIQINSALLSAQNRNRLYWTNIGVEQIGFFGDLECTIPQPKDKGILLKDILETDVADKYFLSGKMLECLKSHEVFNKYTTETLQSENKSSCISARVHKMGNADTYIKVDKKGNIKENQQKASCFTAGGNSGGNHSDMDLIQTKTNIRRLTPKECERLQTVPDNYTNHVSDTQRYKMLGNGWTIDVIAYILSYLR